MPNPTEEQIRARAHELWEQAGKPQGREDELASCREGFEREDSGTARVKDRARLTRQSNRSA